MLQPQMRVTMKSHDRALHQEQEDWTIFTPKPSGIGPRPAAVGGRVSQQHTSLAQMSILQKCAFFGLGQRNLTGPQGNVRPFSVQGTREPLFSPAAARHTPRVAADSMEVEEDWSHFGNPAPPASAAASSGIKRTLDDNVPSHEKHMRITQGQPRRAEGPAPKDSRPPVEEEIIPFFELGSVKTRDNESSARNERWMHMYQPSTDLSVGQLTPSYDWGCAYQRYMVTGRHFEVDGTYESVRKFASLSPEVQIHIPATPFMDFLYSRSIRRKSYRIPDTWKYLSKFVTMEKDQIDKQHFIAYVLPTDMRSERHPEAPLLTREDVIQFNNHMDTSNRVVVLLTHLLESIGIGCSFASLAFSKIDEDVDFSAVFQGHWKMRMSRVLRFLKIMHPMSACTLYQFLLTQIEHKVYNPSTLIPSELIQVDAKTLEHWRQSISEPSRIPW
jgi:hypothetical protein